MRRAGIVAMVGVGFGALLVGLTRRRSANRDTKGALSLRENLREQMLLASRDQADAYARLNRLREEVDRLDRDHARIDQMREEAGRLDRTQ